MSRPPRWFRNKRLLAPDRRLPQSEIALQRLRRFAGVGHLPFLLALAAHANPALVEIEVIQIQAHQFADAQPAPVQQLEDRQIARRIGPFEFVRRRQNAIHQPVGLFGRHHRRQRLRRLRACAPCARRSSSTKPSRSRNLKNDRTAASFRRMLTAVSRCSYKCPSHSRMASASISLHRWLRLAGDGEINEKLIQIRRVIPHRVLGSVLPAQFVEK